MTFYWIDCHHIPLGREEPLQKKKLRSQEVLYPVQGPRAHQKQDQSQIQGPKYDEG